MGDFVGLRALIVCAVSTPEQAADDKESMEAQERDGVEWSSAERCDVVDIVRIPGFSRNFLTFRELMDAAEAKGEFGPTRLWQHIQNKDFDVMVVRATNRLNREQSLNAEIIARVIRAGASIYSFLDGHINKNNYRPMSAITGYRDSVELDELKRKREVGMIGRAKRGLPINGNPPMSHRILYNPENGHEEGLVLRPEHVGLWRDLAALLLENVAYHRLEEELFTRWGYGQNGCAYSSTRMNKLLFNAQFWGNNAIRWSEKTRPHWRGLWIFDPSEPAPDGVDMFWNTHEPVYTGTLAQLVKAELRRRTDVWNGSATRHGIGKFTGIVLCDFCHGRTSYIRKTSHEKVFTYLICNTFRQTGSCTNGHAVREEYVQLWLNKHLERWIARGKVDLSDNLDTIESERSLEEVKLGAQVLKKRMTNYMRMEADADEDLKADYRVEIRKTKDELSRSEAQIRELDQVLQETHVLQETRAFQLERIKRQTLPVFWQQDSLAINQALKALLGATRLFTAERKIKGFIDTRVLDTPHS